MNQEIMKTIRNIENNINHCYILHKLLNDMNKGGYIDYHDFYNKGYKNDEIYLGAQLIDLYIMLKKYIEQIDGCNKNCV